MVYKESLLSFHSLHFIWSNVYSPKDVLRKVRIRCENAVICRFLYLFIFFFFLILRFNFYLFGYFFQTYLKFLAAHCVLMTIDFAGTIYYS